MSFLSAQSRLRLLVTRSISALCSPSLTPSSTPAVEETSDENTQILLSIHSKLVDDTDWNVNFVTVLKSVGSFGHAVVHSSDWSRLKLQALDCRTRMEPRTALRCLVEFSRQRVCGRTDARRFQDAISQNGTGFASLSTHEQISLLHALAILKVEVSPSLEKQIHLGLPSIVENSPVSGLPRLAYGVYHLVVSHRTSSPTMVANEVVHALILKATRSSLRGLLASEKVYLLWALDLLVTLFPQNGNLYEQLLLPALGLQRSASFRNAIAVDLVLGRTSLPHQLRPRERVLLIHTLCSVIMRTTEGGSTVVAPAFYDATKNVIKELSLSSEVDSTSSGGALVAEHLLSSKRRTCLPTSQSLKPHLDALCRSIRSAVLSCELSSRDAGVRLLTTLTRSGYVFCSTDAQLTVHLLLRMVLFQYADAVYVDRREGAHAASSPWADLVMLREVPVLDDRERTELLMQRLSTNFEVLQHRLRSTLRDVELTAVLQVLAICRDLFLNSAPNLDRQDHPMDQTDGADPVTATSTTSVNFHKFYTSIATMKFQGALLTAAPRNVVPLIHAAVQAEVVTLPGTFELCVKRLADGAESGTTQKSVIACASELLRFGTRFGSAVQPSLNILAQLIRAGEDQLGFHQQLNSVLSMCRSDGGTRALAQSQLHDALVRLHQATQQRLPALSATRRRQQKMDLKNLVAYLAKYAHLNSVELSHVPKATWDWLCLSVLPTRCDGNDDVILWINAARQTCDVLMWFVRLGHRSPLTVATAHGLVAQMVFIRQKVHLQQKSDHLLMSETALRISWAIIHQQMQLPPKLVFQALVMPELRSRLQVSSSILRRVCPLPSQVLTVLSGLLHIGADGDAVIPWVSSECLRSGLAVSFSQALDATGDAKLPADLLRHIPLVSEVLLLIWRGTPHVWRPFVADVGLPVTLYALRHSANNVLQLPKSVLMDVVASAAAICLQNSHRFRPFASAFPSTASDPRYAELVRWIGVLSVRLFCDDELKPAFSASTVQEWLSGGSKLENYSTDSLELLGNRRPALEVHSCAKLGWIATVLQSQGSTDASKLLGAQIWRQSVKYLEKLAMVLGATEQTARTTPPPSTASTPSASSPSPLAGDWLDVRHVTGDDLEVESAIMLQTIGSMLCCGASSQSIDTLLQKVKRRLNSQQQASGGGVLDVVSVAGLAEGVLVSAKRRPAVTEFIASAIETQGASDFAAVPYHGLVCLAEFVQRDAERVTLSHARADAVRSLTWTHVENALISPQHHHISALEDVEAFIRSLLQLLVTAPSSECANIASEALVDAGLRWASMRDASDGSKALIGLVTTTLTQKQHLIQAETLTRAVQTFSN